MGRRKGSVNKVKQLPKGVSFLKDGRSRPYIVSHKNLPRESFATAEEAVSRKKEMIRLEKIHGAAALDYDRATHSEVNKMRDILPTGVDLIECARFWVRHHPDGSSMSVPDAVDFFVDHKRMASGHGDREPLNRHVRDLKSRLSSFAAAFGDLLLSEVSGRMIAEWLLSLSLSPRSLDNYRRALQNFFNFSVRKNLCGLSPMDKLTRQDLPKVPTSKKNPLSIDQAKLLLELIESEAPQYLAHFALRLLLGFRTSEARRFRWEWIQPEQDRVYIPANATKTDDAWSIDDVPIAFWKLIKKPFNSGSVPAPYVRFWDGCKAIKGKRTAHKGFKDRILKELGIVNWPSNTTRDTFCTLHISAYRDPQRTALILKHTNTQTLWQSYLGTLIPKESAIKFFEG